MKYIFQFARIMGFCLAGEVLRALLPLPIPAGIYGLVASICNLTFDPAKEKNIGYKKD